MDMRFGYEKDGCRGSKIMGDRSRPANASKYVRGCLRGRISCATVDAFMIDNLCIVNLEGRE